ncbi:MAG: SPOR domain-containing protein [Bacteroidota bacterium]
MPDLNLIDEGELEETSAPAAPPVKKKKVPSGGGGGKIVIVLLLILIIGGGAFYVLNHRGLINIKSLWKKKAPVQQVQEETFPPEAAQQAVPQQTAPDSSQVALLETPPAEEQKNANAAEPQKESAPAEKAAHVSKHSKLDEMNGEYTIQVIAFHEKKKAEEIRVNLEAADYPAFVEKVPMKGGSWYRVCIGRYGSRDAAKKAVKSFASQLQSSYIVDKVMGN